MVKPKQITKQLNQESSSAPRKTPADDWWRICNCRACGEEIIVELPEACEVPMCSRVKCVEILFPDFFKEVKESNKKFLKVKDETM